MFGQDAFALSQGDPLVDDFAFCRQDIQTQPGQGSNTIIR
jgi:hypothetical protein